MAAGSGFLALSALVVLATAVWVGGLATLVVVTVVASRTLKSADRVAFFRALGRAYGIVAGSALVVALGAGAALVRDRPWDGLLATTVAVAVALVVVLVVGIVQARRMTRLRERSLRPGECGEAVARVHRAARRARALRALIGLLSLALLVLGTLLLAPAG